MTDNAPLILSASSVKEYLNCGYKYLLSSVYRVPAPPNMAMAIGSAVHAGVEALHNRSQHPGDALRAALDREVASMPTAVIEDRAGAAKEAGMMLEMYRTKVASRFKPTLIEASFIVDVDGILVSGQIDGADEDIRDTKTTAALTGFNAARHRFQLNLYRFGYRHLTGRWPRRLYLDILTRNGKYKEVEIEVDPQEAMDALRLTRDGILGGSFDPTGADNGSCRFCPYSTGVCSYARLD